MKKPTVAQWWNRSKRNHSTKRRGHAPAEMLEQRIVPVTTTFASGTLTITATSAAEMITVTASAGNVVVNGMATATPAANVDSLIVQGGTGANRINLSGVTEAAFLELDLVSIVGGAGNDTIIGSGIGDTIVWNNGDGSDSIDGGAGQDRLAVNGSTTGGDSFTVMASGSRLSVRRTSLTGFTLNVGTVEDLVISTGGGDDTIRIGNTANSGLDSVTVLGGSGVDTTNLTGVNLEALRVLTVDGEDGNDVVVVSAGSDANNGMADQFVLSLVDTADGPETEFFVNGITLFAGADESAVLQIEGSRDADILTVNHDELLGSPVPFNGVQFNAGSGTAIDQLVIAGAVETAIYGFDSTRNGSAQVDLRTIRFSALEAISDTSSATARTVFFANGSDQINLADDTMALDDRILKLTSLAGGPALTFVHAVGGSLTIDGGGGNDTVNVRALDDLFSGDLLLDGFSGNDTFIIANQSNVVGFNLSVDGGEGRDTIDATLVTQGVVLFGGTGDDTIRAGTGNDQLFGQEGADLLVGGEGNDAVDGGDGNDVLAETKDADFALTPGTLAGIGSDTIAALERVELTGGDSSNVIDASASAVSVVLRGGGGLDELIGSPFNDTIFGGAGNDTISGLGGVDSLNGEADNDSLTGGIGNDQLVGGVGNDDFEWVNGDGSDAISGGQGEDALQVFGSDADGDVFRLISNGSGTRLTRTNLVAFTINFNNVESVSVEADGRDGGAAEGGGADSLTVALSGGTERPSDINFGGGEGNDTLDAAATNIPVFAFGDAGDDSLIGGRGADTLQGGDGDDVLTGNSGADVLNGNAGEDIISGGAGNDLMNGGDDDDMLDGGADNDAIAGFGGDDVVTGGTGIDTLAGGSGDGADVNENDEFPGAVEGEVDEEFLFTNLANWINDA
ncbi:MAG: beta strand repeat-containing protein [Planctomycetaceae bacterium]